MTSAPRLGARGLAQLQQRLSDRDLAVLAEVHRRRLMTGRQLQCLYFGDDLKAARAAGRLLLRLTSHRLLVRLPRRIGGVRAGSASFVYALGPVGQRLLEPDRLSSYRIEVGDGFIVHTVALAQVCVELTIEARHGAFDLLRVDSEPQSWRPIDTIGGRDWLKPDLHVVTVNEETEWHNFVEWDEGTEHRPALLRKLRAYELAYRAGREQAEHGIFPRVVWLVPSNRRQRLLKRLIASHPDITADLHVVGEHEDRLALLTGHQAP